MWTKEKLNNWKQKRRKTAAAWRALNIEKVRENSRVWCQKNKNKVAKKSKAWYAIPENKTKSIKRTIRWAKENKQKVRLSTKQYHWKLKYNITKNEVIRMLKNQNNACIFCGTILNLNIVSIDLIICRAKNGPITFKNMQATCWPCNRGKGTLSNLEYILLCKAVVKNTKRLK